MNIDVYIQLLKDHCNNLDHEEMDRIANWLEELKTLRMTDRECVYHKAYEQGRADAIDEYKLKILNEKMKKTESVNRLNSEIWVEFKRRAIEIAEQLKEQSND